MRAYYHFQERGGSCGDDWRDWLRAERELLWKPHAEMFENGYTLVVRVGVPGFDPKALEVTATPHWLLIKGSEIHDHEGLDCRLHFCEFGRELFRIFEFPSRIQPKTVSATWDRGVVEVLGHIARVRKPDPDETEGRGAG